MRVFEHGQVVLGDAGFEVVFRTLGFPVGQSGQVDAFQHFKAALG